MQFILVYFLLLYQNIWGWVLHKEKMFIWFTVLEAESLRLSGSPDLPPGESPFGHITS